VKFDGAQAAPKRPSEPRVYSGVGRANLATQGPATARLDHDAERRPVRPQPSTDFDLVRLAGLQAGVVPAPTQFANQTLPDGSVIGPPRRTAS
jgi:hypothetical protein